MTMYERKLAFLDLSTSLFSCTVSSVSAGDEEEVAWKPLDSYLM